MSLWFQDADGDAFGAAGTSEWACEAPAGMVADGSDCDDNNSTVYPGAPEVCLDGVYNDCADVDGADAAVVCGADGAYSLAYADARLLGREADDVAGIGLVGAGDTNGDGWGDVVVTDLHSSIPGEVSPDGVAYLVLGPISGDRSLSVADSSIVFEGLISANFRPGLAAAGDLDGDGLDDLFIGEAHESLDGVYTGAVWLFDGPILGELTSADASARIGGVSGGDYAGQAVAVPGDVDGDGWEDLVVGAPYADGPDIESDRGACPTWDAEEFGTYEHGEDSGSAYLLLGPVSGDRSLSSADLTLSAEDGGDVVGYSLSTVGDLDGDGLPELFVGAIGQCEGGVTAGAAYVVSGAARGDVSLEDADLKLIGEYGGDWAGYAISGGGDVNGDGTPDLLIGAPYWPSGVTGRAYVELGFASGIRSLSESAATITGDDAGDQLGSAVSSTGDLDGDGFDDLAIGAPTLNAEGFSEASGVAAGAVFLFHGPLSGAYDASDADRTLYGPEAYDTAGDTIATAGDVDADGLPDLLIGAIGADGDTEGSGAALLLLGAGPILTGTLAP